MHRDKIPPRHPQLSEKTNCAGALLVHNSLSFDRKVMRPFRENDKMAAERSNMAPKAERTKKRSRRSRRGDGKGDESGMSFVFSRPSPARPFQSGARTPRSECAGMVHERMDRLVIFRFLRPLVNGFSNLPESGGK